MRALTVTPGQAASAALAELAEPPPREGPVLVAGRLVGVCGTDREIVAGLYGGPPPGRDRLVLGHESLGRVLDAPSGAELTVGDLVCGIVRHPDPVPCPSCAVGEWDMCRNGRYTEHGIRGRDGFARARYRLELDHVVRVAPVLEERGVLLEPASVVAKAWDHIDRIGQRARWTPARAVVLGAGPIGLLAALMGVQRGLEIHVLDRVRAGPKPSLVADLGATYHADGVDRLPPSDVVIECTGAPALVLAAMHAARADGIVCLAGVSSGGRRLPVDAGALGRELVLENNVVFGSVNANRHHYALAAAALAGADQAWLDRLVTRRVPLARWRDAFSPRPDDVKVVLELDG
jgi:threonine dehydrogenase-like Zn-dependent dehydrogenase